MHQHTSVIKLSLTLDFHYSLSSSVPPTSPSQTSSTLSVLSPTLFLSHHHSLLTLTTYHLPLTDLIIFFLFAAPPLLSLTSTLSHPNIHHKHFIPLKSTPFHPHQPTLFHSSHYPPTSLTHSYTTTSLYTKNHSHKPRPLMSLHLPALFTRCHLLLLLSLNPQPYLH